jgi:hypothetical protein
VTVAIQVAVCRVEVAYRACWVNVAKTDSLVYLVYLVPRAIWASKAILD